MSQASLYVMRKVLKMGGLAVFVAAAGLLGSCDSRFIAETDEIIVERRPDTDYEKLFPYYVELCAVSQFRSKLTGMGGARGTRRCISRAPATT
jgi:hypothetical protein